MTAAASVGFVPQNFSVAASAVTATERLGEVFSLVPWWKVDFEDYTKVRYIENATNSLFFLIFVEFIISIFRGVKIYRKNDTIMSLSLGIISTIGGFYMKTFQISCLIAFNKHFAITQLVPGSLSAFIFGIIFTDFLYYWLHRNCHEVHTLWVGHKVHHSGEDYNLATALRQGILQGVFTFVYFLPVGLFMNPALVIAHKQLNTLVQFWIHTELIGDTGFLEYVLNTPSHHRMHHRPPGNRNYAGLLIIWDRMFGTFQREDKQEDYYGLSKQYETFDPVYQNFEHFDLMFNNIPTNKTGFAKVIEILTKRRVKHKFVFKPFEIFKPFEKIETQTENKADLWAIPNTSKRQKYDGKEKLSSLTQSYILFLFSAALLSSLVVLKQQDSVFIIQFNDENFKVFVLHSLLLFQFISIGRLSDGLKTGISKYVNSVKLAYFLLLNKFIDIREISNDKINSEIFTAYIIIDLLFWSLVLLIG